MSGLQPAVGLLALHAAGLDQQRDQRGGVRPAPGLLGERQVERLAGDGPQFDQDRPDAKPGVHVVRADDETVAEAELALALGARQPQGAGLAGLLQQLDDVDEGEVLQITGKGHLR